MRVLLLVLVAFLAACSSDSESGNNSNNANNTNNSNNVNNVNNTNNAVDMGPQCEETPECTDDQRIVGCKCVFDLDRQCLTDADCREDETCREVDDVKVCWWEAPPVLACPGAPSCDGGGDGILYVGASSKVITPVGFETPREAGLNDDGVHVNFDPGLGNIAGRWRDCGFDNICPEDPGYTGPDEGEGDDIAQGIWISGFRYGRAARMCPEEKIGCDEVDCCVSKWAHDDLKVQVSVFRRNDVTVAFAVADVTGLFHTDIELIRKRIPEDWGVDVLVMSATHNHEAPDMQGQWGPGAVAPSRSGVSPEFRKRIQDQTLAGIEESLNSLEEADIHATILDVGVDGLAVNDSRTPYIFDDNVPIIWARSKSTGETITTMLSFANHPEVLWSENTFLTADYPHFARKYIEEGLAATTGAQPKPAIAGAGGVTLLFAGALGGLIYPGPGGAKTYAGDPIAESHSWESADAVGQTLASHVLTAMQNDQLTEIPTPDLAFASKRYLTEVENTVFQLAGWGLKVFARDVYNVTGSFQRFKPGNPFVQSQAVMVKLGPITIFTGPGEVFPETLVGGYPGKPRIQTPVIGDTEGRRVAATCDDQGLPTPNDDGTNPCIIKKDAENPPDWANAPDGPYVYEQIPGQFPFFIGLGMDHLGYMVPSYDFDTTYFQSAPGDHYEETNSAGSGYLGDWLEAIPELADALPQ